MPIVIERGQQGKFQPRTCVYIAGPVDLQIFIHTVVMIFITEDLGSRIGSFYVCAVPVQVHNAYNTAAYGQDLAVPQGV